MTKLELFSLLMGLAVLAIGYTSSIGLVYSLKAIRGQNRLKKIVGLVINICFFSLFLYAIVSNIMDIYKFMSI